jgi:hypothetical protein
MPVARLTQRFEGCHILAQVMRLVRYAPDCFSDRHIV